ncbi:hypothetical protein H4582DRAFT_1904182 [Lactarius indigo]|nr:hypothetical protein H4582DRAFT_1904182 [Lactarius indigo]
MPGPQSPYPHPGPSSYYPPPPNMPHYSYTNVPAHYPYQYPPPPMNGHSPAPPSPRPGPNFTQNYLHHPHPHPHHPPPSHTSYIPHVPMHSPQPSPTNTYQHHQKYPPTTQQVPYTSPYPPPAHQPNATYQQSWAFQQPISPLPKQLSMPPPPALSPIASSPKAPMILDGPLDPEPTDETAGSSDPRQDPSPEPVAEEPALASPSVVTRLQASQSLPSTPQVSIHPEPVPAPNKSQAPPHPKPQLGGWAIWSRRPTDPSLAPGIIISPHSRPPPDVIEKALRLPTPPESPKPVAANLVPPSNVAVVSGSLSTQAPPEEPPKPTLDSAESPPNDLPEPETVSSSGTDNSTFPVSPLSSSTSVSAAGTAHSQTKLGLEASERSPILMKLHSVEVSDSTAVAPSSSADTSTPTPPPAFAPSSAPPVLKKSWASLLRPTSGDSSTSKSSLPTSSLLALLNGTAPSRYSALPRLRARGIVNSGNMCFANAVLQLLVYSPPFWRLFKELGRLMGRREREAPESGDGATPLVDATVKLLEEFAYEEKKPLPAPQQQGSRSKAKEEEEKKEEENVDSFMPTYVYDAMKEKKRFDNMRGGHQEDAEEFLGFYLDTLEEELLGLLSSISPPKPASAVSDKVEEREEGLQSGAGWTEVGKRNKMVLTRAVKSVESPITRIFGGKFRSTLRAPHQRDSVVVEDWRSLQLDIQRDSVHTIQEALSYISHPQPVEVGPSGSSEASQQVHIEALPPVLVLHLKRFLYDTACTWHIMAPACRRPARYTLYGVLYHHGVSAGGGHYTLDVLHPNPRGGTSSGGVAGGNSGEAWLHIDDETVSAVQHEDVFGRGNGKERNDDRCAYLLFYRRAALART